MSKQRNYIRITINTIISLCILMATIMLSVTATFNAFDYTSSIIEDEALRELNPDISTITLNITDTTTLDEIANILYENNFITNKTYFKVEAKLYGGDKGYIPGEYKISSNMSSTKIFSRLTTTTDNTKNTIKFTIPEGFTVSQIAETLDVKGIVTKENFLDAVQNKDYSDSYYFLENIPNKDDLKYKLEGYLFPDTYIVPKNITSEEIIVMMLNRFEEIITPYNAYIQSSGYTMHEILTIASIIEQEAKISEERPIISGVIHNRLNANMNLQMCSTIQYSLSQRKSALTLSDLEIDTPFNTYKYSGLPIGPISSAGDASIRAACKPESHNYLFFVLEDEENGSHVFSSTLDQHAEAKNKYHQNNDINFID